MGTILISLVTSDVECFFHVPIQHLSLFLLRMIISSCPSYLKYFLLCLVSAISGLLIHTHTDYNYFLPTIVYLSTL